LQPIPDHLRAGLKIIFIGFNPSLRSGETGHHYANPSNRFWKVLHEAGLSPRRYRPEEDDKLLEIGFGLTNIAARPTRSAAEITREEYRQGRELLREKLEKYRPRAACFVGKGVYEAFSGKSGVGWGAQEGPVVPGVIDFVAPSSSGLVRMKREEIVEIYRGLKIFL
jgi:TDG/mug DNA glycosylase family protein